MDEVIFPGSTLTRGQLFVLFFGLTVRHNLNKFVIRDLLTLLNIVIPGCIQKNIYFWDKFLGQDVSIDTHVLCKVCQDYICKYDENSAADFCSSCNTPVDCQSLISDGSFFLTCSLES